ncbi:conserved hypothetical protein [Aspergillus fumigatus A1163]|uniref:Uncharacterized protein n=1 Tax=Aspergillus fumigatus (strain CBS 144.89 / FGSC A1163 / CEA10) TaxID=451804 RepID=B0Y5A8_ASPFC|nr:conserved hypothetical protein [Aspergillus fumigatus A1163]
MYRLSVKSRTRKICNTGYDTNNDDNSRHDHLGAPEYVSRRFGQNHPCHDEFHSIRSLINGKIYTLFSVKWTLLRSILVFEASSALSGAGHHSTTLIVGHI